MQPQDPLQPQPQYPVEQPQAQPLPNVAASSAPVNNLQPAPTQPPAQQYSAPPEVNPNANATEANLTDTNYLESNPYASYQQPEVIGYQAEQGADNTYQPMSGNEPAPSNIPPAGSNQPLDTSQLFAADPSYIATPSSNTELPTPTSPKKRIILGSIAMIFILIIGGVGLLSILGQNDKAQQNQQATVNEEMLTTGLENEGASQASTATDATNSDPSDASTDNNSGSTASRSTSSSSSSTSGQTSSTNSPSSSSSKPAATPKKKSSKKVTTSSPAYSISCSVVAAQKNKVNSAVLAQTAASIRAAYGGTLDNLTAWVPSSLASAKVSEGPVEAAFKSLRPKSCSIDMALYADQELTALTVRATFSQNSKGTAYQSMFTLKKVGNTWKTVSVTSPFKG